MHKKLKTEKENVKQYMNSQKYKLVLLKDKCARAKGTVKWEHGKCSKILLLQFF